MRQCGIARRTVDERVVSPLIVRQNRRARRSSARMQSGYTHAPGYLRSYPNPTPNQKNAARERMNRAAKWERKYRESVALKPSDMSLFGAFPFNRSSACGGRIAVKCPHQRPKLLIVKPARTRQVRCDGQVSNFSLRRGPARKHPAYHFVKARASRLRANQPDIGRQVFIVIWLDLWRFGTQGPKFESPH